MAAKQKNFYALGFIFFILAAAGIIFTAVYFAGKLFNPDNPACPTNVTNHSVTVRHGVVTPDHTTAKRCDTLVITNLDDRNRLMAFGDHYNHQPYDGVEEKLIGKNQSWRVRLTEIGNFRFHDHLEDSVQGIFSVQTSN